MISTSFSLAPPFFVFVLAGFGLSSSSPARFLFFPTTLTISTSFSLDLPLFGLAWLLLSLTPEYRICRSKKSWLTLVWKKLYPRRASRNCKLIMLGVRISQLCNMRTSSIMCLPMKLTTQAFSYSHNVCRVSNRFHIFIDQCIGYQIISNCSILKSSVMDRRTLTVKKKSLLSKQRLTSRRKDMMLFCA
ncbi:hypothetical protein ABW21_db0202062 [Orbilia brochopaga]|nr:hypothetical protein ABW21_db0202062 [Drechslerella brochopaga]